MSNVSTSGTAVEFSHAARYWPARRGSVAWWCQAFAAPRVVGAQRTLRRHPSGAVVAVQVKSRPWFAVVADMIEGVVVVNRLQPPAGDRLRTELWAALGYESPIGEGSKVA